MKKPTDQHIDITNAVTGRKKTVVFHSYVAILCEKDGENVTAVRVDGQSNKEDVIRYLGLTYTEQWNIKDIYRLYDEDFKP